MARLFPDNTWVGPKEGPLSRVAVGEAAGEEENATGLPFVGGSGRWLEFLYKKVGVDKSKINIVNTICCHPPNNIYPLDHEARGYISKIDAEKAVTQCLQNHVWPFLKSRRWNRIDLLGAKALELVGGKQGGIYKWRGSPIVISELGDVPNAIATLHPAALAREQQMLPAVINDLRKGTTPPPEFYNLHPSLEDVRAFTATTFAFDIETAYWWGDAAKILCVGLSDRLYHAMVVPFEGAYIPELRRIFSNAKVYIGQNSVSFDQPMLERNGVKFNPNAEHHDVMLLHHLRFPDLPHGLEDLGSFFTTKGIWKDGKKDDLARYNAIDSDITYQVWKQLLPMIHHAELWELYQNVQIPLAKICRLMNDLGVKIDPTRVDEVRAKIKLAAKEDEKKLPECLRTHEITVKKRQVAPEGTLGKSGKPVKYTHVDTIEHVIPWASSDVVKKYLYDELKLEPVYDLKTKKLTSGKMALDKLKGWCRRNDRLDDAGAIEAIRSLRKKASILNLFAKESLGKAGTIHTSFLPHGTSSGRLSSSKPNLQNVTEVARCLYVPRHPGWSLIDIDFSSIESRLTAYLANDTDRLHKYLTIPNYSEHKYLAALITGCDYDDVVKDNSRDAPYGKAKACVHGSNYGLGAKKMSLMNDTDFKETKELLERWKREIAKTVEWQNRVATQAKKEGVLTTPFSRKRYFYTSNAYCVTPETRVLTADLRWVAVGTLKTGDTLVGFDEDNASGRGAGRKFRKATVEATGRKRLPCYQIATDRGAVTASSDHGFLVKRKQSQGAAWKDVWIPSRLLQAGDRIRYFGSPWTEDTTKDGGWLAGLLDGEGSLADYAVTCAQNEGSVLDRALKTFKAHGYKITRQYTVENLNPLTKEPTGKFNVRFSVAEENYQRMRVLGSLRPTRLLEQAEETWVNRRISSRRPKYATVLEVNFRGACEVVSLQTSTRTLLTEGLFSHNTESLSFLPQSTAADIIFRCMIALLYERIGWPLERVQRVVQYIEPLPYPANLLLAVHDSLVLECPNELLPQVIGVLTRVMTQPWPELGGFSIPVSVAVGPSWGETEPYTGSAL